MQHLLSTALATLGLKIVAPKSDTTKAKNGFSSSKIRTYFNF